jgi:hypothetical protein
MEHSKKHTFELESCARQSRRAALCLALLGTAGLFACDAGNQSAPDSTAGAGAVSASGASSGGSSAGGAVSPNGGSSNGGAANGGAALGGSANGGTVVNGGSSGASTNASGAGGQINAAGSGGASPTAGAAGSTASGGADGTFTLAWQDDFNTLDSSAWQLENFTYDGNEAQFTPQNAQVANGTLTISLTPAAAGAAKPYLGVEMRSVKTLTYGKVSARMRFAKGSGVVSGLVLFYTPFPNCDWNEIDVEHLGDVATSSQLNAMVYTGVQNPNCTASVTPTPDPLVTPLGFDAEADYHLYDIEWTPTSVRYIADGVVLRTWTKNIALLVRPQNILLTIWASNAPTWAGALNASSAPTSADIDWIKVYDWHS